MSSSFSLASVDLFPTDSKLKLELCTRARTERKTHRQSRAQSELRFGFALDDGQGRQDDF